MIFDFFKKNRGNKSKTISRLSILRNVGVGEYVAIRPLVKIERSKINKCTSIGTLSAVYDAEIGKFCSIARECYIGGASHPLDRVSSSCCFYLKENYTSKCYFENDYKWQSFTKIGNDVWIGSRSIILGGVTISDGAVIGGGSVVTKDVGPYEIWAGNPARFIRKRFDDETIKKILDSHWWDWPDEKLYKYGSKFIDVSDFLELLNKEAK